MGTRYVIAVMKVEDTEEGQYSTRDTTLFEATHADPARLARFAPEEVLAVLAEAAGVEIAVPAVGLLPRPEMTPEEESAAEIPAPAEDKPKRSRRTKAQIEADKAAQAAGFRDAAHRATEQRLDGEPEPALPAQVGESIEQHAAAADVFGQSATGAAPGEAFAGAVGGFAQPVSASLPPAAPATTGQVPTYDPFK